MIWHIWTWTAAGLRELPAVAGALDEISRGWPGGFYTTFRTVDQARKVVGLRRHLERLYRPAAAQAIWPACSPDQLRCWLDEALDFVRPDEARVRLQLGLDGSLWIAAGRFQPPPQTLYQQGVTAILVPFRRTEPQLKRSDYVEARQAALDQVQAAGAYEGLIVHGGRIWEGLTSNFFWVHAGVLGTAGRNVLPGVTRNTLLRLARGADMPVRLRALQVKELPLIEEAFLCSSSRGALPIVSIDGQPVGSGQPGPLTLRLMELYNTEMAQLAEPLCPG